MKGRAECVLFFFFFVGSFRFVWKVTISTLTPMHNEDDLFTEKRSCFYLPLISQFRRWEKKKQRAYITFALSCEFLFEWSLFRILPLVSFSERLNVGLCGELVFHFGSHYFGFYVLLRLLLLTALAFGWHFIWSKRARAPVRCKIRLWTSYSN